MTLDEFNERYCVSGSGLSYQEITLENNSGLDLLWGPIEPGDTHSIIIYDKETNESIEHTNITNGYEEEALTLILEHEYGVTGLRVEEEQF